MKILLFGILMFISSIANAMHGGYGGRHYEGHGYYHGYHGNYGGHRYYGGGVYPYHGYNDGYYNYGGGISVNLGIVPPIDYSIDYYNPYYTDENLELDETE